MRSLILNLLLLISVAGCVRTQTVLVQPGQPIRLLTPITASGKSTATEIAQGQWIVNDAPVILPAGAYIVVLPAVSNVERPKTRP